MTPLLLLLGLVAVGWWRKAAPQDHSPRTGIGLLASVRAHRPYVDLLDGMSLWVAFRAVGPLAVVYGASPSAWVALAVAWLSRIVGTDTCRFLFWAAPPFIAGLDVPAWVVLPAVGVHIVTFRRAI